MHGPLNVKCVLASCHSKGVAARRVRWPSTVMLTGVYRCVLVCTDMLTGVYRCVLVCADMLTGV
jgi:hypothetical protein